MSLIGINPWKSTTLYGTAYNTFTPEPSAQWHQTECVYAVNYSQLELYYIPLLPEIREYYDMIITKRHLSNFLGI